VSGIARRVDHLVLAVHDLAEAAAFYEKLGFQVGARNRHPWGTENHVIQFDSSFLELITVSDAERIPPHALKTFSFGRFVQDYLAHREGLAMLVLDSTDARVDAASFARAGIGDFAPFSFERTGRAADGTETLVAFSLAFASDDRLPDAGFFTCEQHHPDAFWSPRLQRHPNGGTNVIAVSLDVKHPEQHTAFLSAFTGTLPTEEGRLFPLEANGALHLKADLGVDRFTGFKVAVPTIEAATEELAASRIPFQKLHGRVIIAPDQCFGVQLEFAEVATPDQEERGMRTGHPSACGVARSSRRGSC
jgi:catechol 2,3-dioxygenase-like lactoylglutathione lyase family enzyme